LPALVHIDAEKSKNTTGKKFPGRNGPLVLILSPTRELAMQTAQVATDAGSAVGVFNEVVFGGVSIDPQIRAIKLRNPEIITATPGRLIDLLEREILWLGRVSYLVLDEADRMLDMGFEPDIRRIIGLITSKRQTLMFSATWPQEIRKLAGEFMTTPCKVTVGSDDLSANTQISQVVEVVEDYEKDKKLLGLLKKFHKKNNRILIFVLYKKEVPHLENMLTRSGYSVGGLSGEKSQNFRTQAFGDFKTGRVPILIATDVAARGLDIPDVEHVINYSFPLTVEDYVHRIGRTGRAGKTGCSHTFFTKNDCINAGELIKILEDAKQPVPESIEQWREK